MCARYVETAFELDRLRRAGKIARLGVTNFDTPRLSELVEAGLSIAAHQLQYSVVDGRPATSMIELCRTHDIAVLCYGTVCGGFLSERWLGCPEPPSSQDNRSLTKYKLIIDDFGGWGLFQELLAQLAKILAARRGNGRRLGGDARWFSTARRWLRSSSARPAPRTSTLTRESTGCVSTARIGTRLRR